ncbi:MAG TPA: glycosyltransferase 87 family protein [Actinomycetales bacterium]|nr:glycosyltransferase 87 family protein [Actinomycetales bacterium]
MTHSSSLPVVAPTTEDPVARRLSAVVGGPAGARLAAVQRGWWTAARVLVVLALVVVALGVVQKQHCRAEGWSTPDQFFHACYSDLPAMYQTAGLRDGTMPYLQQADGVHLEQPVLTGTVMWALAKVVPGGGLLEQTHWYFDVSTLLIALLVVALVLLTVTSAGRRRPWDAALVALSPLLLLSALVSLDLLGVVLAAGGLLAWGRRRPVWAGLLLGLGITARTYPAVLLVVLALVALRTGRWTEWVRAVAAALATVLVVLVPWAVVNLDGLRPAYRSWRDSTAGYGSVWLLPQTLFAEPRPRWARALGLEPHAFSAGTVTALAVTGLVVALVVGLLVTLAPPQRPRVAQVAFVVLAVVVLTGKSWPVQASLWLLPLAALARPRWRDHLIWAGAEASYFVAVWLFIAASSNPDRALPAPWYGAILLVRVAALLWLVGVVIRDMWHPDRDPVRATGDDDPLAGPFEGADDAVVVRFV